MKKIIFGAVLTACLAGIGGSAMYASDLSDAYINIDENTKYHCYESTNERTSSIVEIEGLDEDPEFTKRQTIPMNAIKSPSQSTGYSGGEYFHNQKFENSKLRNGIDVSYYQGFIDWDKVRRAGIDFAFIRAAYRGYESGALVVDPAVSGNIRGAIDAGIRVGVYIFSQAINVDEAIEEANFTIDQIGENEVTLPVVIDYEYVSKGVGRLYKAGLNSYQTTEIINAFCDQVRKRGYTPLIYANKNMLENDINSWDLNANVWLANYVNGTEYQGQYSVWQYTSSGYVDGVPGLVDCDFAYDFSDDYAYEQSIKDGVYNIKLAANDKFALDIFAGSNENSANLHLWEFIGNEAQQFEVKHIGEGKYTIKAICSDKYLDAQGTEVTLGTNVAQYQYNGGKNQQWYIDKASNGAYRIRSVSNQMCLDVFKAEINNGSNIGLWMGQNDTAQTFRFDKVVVVNNEYVKEGYNGWYKLSGEKYWYDNGIMARDKEVYDSETNAWYWFDADGTMARDKDAFIPTNPERTQGKWVRYNDNGGMIKGEDFRYGGWYWFDPVTGEMIKGFVHIPVDGDAQGKWVYYDDINGQMHHGESLINGNWYYFDEFTGKMAHGECFHHDNWYYYDDVTGIMRRGEVVLSNGETAYYDEVTGIRR